MKIKITTTEEITLDTDEMYNLYIDGENYLDYPTLATWVRNLFENYSSTEIGIEFDIPWKDTVNRRVKIEP